MKHRVFGRSGIKVSEIVFGAGAVGGILIHKDDGTKREAIRRALAGGINWIDTAAQYGNGKSEEALGWLLPEAGATPYLSTKFQLAVENLKDIPAQIEERLRASLARLKRASVDLLQLHNRIGSKPGGRVMTVEQILGANTSIPEEERKTKAVFEAIGTGEGTRAQVALRFVLSNPDVSCAVIGSAELHHIDEALQAAEMGPLPAQTLARLDALYESDFRRV